MISFRAIATQADGAATVAYFMNRPSPSQGAEDEPNPDADQRDSLVAYYTGRNALSMWREDMPASVAKALGIDPNATPTKKEIARLYEGKRADTGEQLAGGKRELSGYDFTFSPHKSVTLAAEFAESPAEAAAIRNAIARANDDAIRYIAKEIGWARRGKAGCDGADPGEVGWISYTHYDARPTLPLQDGRHGETSSVEAPVPGDPQEHIHNTMFNLVVTDEGRVGSLDTKRLRSRVHEFGAYGQARLAEELRKLGIRTAYDAKEQAVVVVAIPSAANDAFSKSRAQILTRSKAFARHQGLDWDDLSQDDKLRIIAGAASAARLAKHGNKTDQEIWRAQAEAIGWNHKTVMEGIEHEALTHEQRFDRAYAFAARHLAEDFRTAAALDHDRLRTYAARGLIATGIDGGPEDIDQVVALLEHRGIEIDGETAHLVSARVKKPGAKGQMEEILRVTNSAQIRIEQSLLAEVRRAARDKSSALEPAAIRAAIASSGIDFTSEPSHGEKQIAAIHALGQGGALTLLTGFAGSGKSTLLQPLVRAWKAQSTFDPGGRMIVGTSTAWKQANELEDAGIEQRIALDPLLRSIDTGEFQPTPNTILVIDEVSQIGPKSMLKLLRLQAETGMTIKLIGDPEQAQSIEAGNTIELLRRALPKEAQPEILSTVRQTTSRDRRIATLFRKEAAAEALAMKREDGTARLVGGDHDQVVAAIADLYLSRRDLLRASGAKKGITISALTNEDADEISKAIREKLKKRGEIASDEIVYEAIAPRGSQNSLHFDLPIATGDHLRLYRRTWATIDGTGGAIGSNGDIVQVVSRSDTHIALKDKKGRIGEVEWRRLIDPGTGRLLLGFGHALTIDSAQGITSDEHIDALPRGSAGITAYKAYVAESRARGTTWTMISEAAVREVERQRRPLGDRRPVTEDDLWARIAEDMAYKPTKTLGIDIAESARRMSGQAADSFLRQGHALHTWSESGGDPGRVARERVYDKTFSERFADHLSALGDAIRKNAEILRDALQEIDTHLRTRSARSTPVPGTPSRDEQVPAGRKTTPSLDI